MSYRGGYRHPGSGGEFATNRRGPPDADFIASHRALGRSDATIANMLGVSLQDVTGIDSEPPPLAAVKRQPAPPPRPEPRPMAMNIPDVAEIIYHVAQVYSVTPEDILGYSHAPGFVEPRHEAYSVVWELNRYTLAELAQLFNKTPPAISYGLERHYERLRADDRSGW